MPVAQAGGLKTTPAKKTSLSPPKPLAKHSNPKKKTNLFVPQALWGEGLGVAFSHAPRETKGRAVVDVLLLLPHFQEWISVGSYG